MFSLCLYQTKFQRSDFSKTSPHHELTTMKRGKRLPENSGFNVTDVSVCIVLSMGRLVTGLFPAKNDNPLFIDLLRIFMGN
jgi:hypothetical protein